MLARCDVVGKQHARLSKRRPELVHESAYGTNRTSSNVRILVSYRGKAEV